MVLMISKRTPDRGPLMRALGKAWFWLQHAYQIACYWVKYVCWPSYRHGVQWLHLDSKSVWKIGENPSLTIMIAPVYRFDTYGRSGLLEVYACGVEQAPVRCALKTHKIVAVARGLTVLDASWTGNADELVFLVSNDSDVRAFYDEFVRIFSQSVRMFDAVAHREVTPFGRVFVTAADVFECFPPGREPGRPYLYR